MTAEVISDLKLKTQIQSGYGGPSLFFLINSFLTNETIQYKIRVENTNSIYKQYKQQLQYKK